MDFRVCVCVSTYDSGVIMVIRYDVHQWELNCSRGKGGGGL